MAIPIQQSKVCFSLRRMTIRTAAFVFLSGVFVAGSVVGGVFAYGQTGQTAGQRPAQAAPAQKELMAEDVYKNIQVLKGTPENQFLSTMGFFSASIGESCEFCHDDESSWAGYAKDNEHKQTARKMILMMNAINKSYFGGARKLTCYSCHRGTDFPEVTPNLAEQ